MSARDIYERHGDTGKPLHLLWMSMRRRCTAGYSEHKYYFDRGITVCAAWDRNYKDFRAWALSHGYSTNLQIDRIDNDKGYSPENCRFVDVFGQANNKRVNIRLSAFGETKNAAQWARDPRCRTCYRCFVKRIRRGWTPERALTERSLSVTNA